MPPAVVDPNSPRFTRGSFVARFNKSWYGRSLHPLNRAALEPLIKSNEPDDWRHTLGAVDVFMDNMGMLAAEQFEPGDHGSYQLQLPYLLGRYWRATRILLREKPWFGKYLLGKGRKAQAGKPLPFLRLLGSRGATSSGVSLIDRETDSPSRVDYEQRFYDWEWGSIWPRDYSEPEETTGSGLREVNSRGAVLPDGFPTETQEPILLSLDFATPELPLHCGVTRADLAIYRRFVFDQNPHPTCVASATATALAVAGARAGKGHSLPRGGFSVSWIHHASDELNAGWSAGRKVESARHCLHASLPCSERAFPYVAGPTETAASWRSVSRVSDADAVTCCLGMPRVMDVDLSDIAEVKTLLAAGWVVVFGLAWPTSWTGHSRFNLYGMPATPLSQIPYDQGHAMVLVGYDHVDGNNQWKYQGRFYCLNSWSTRWPDAQACGPGICSLPFALFLTQGLPGAFAVRF